MSEAEKIAAGLSGYERAALQCRIVFISKRDGLVGKGLLTPNGGTKWTLLGLAVRAHLEGKNNG